MLSNKHKMAKRLEGTDKNVWVEFSQMTLEHKALNLGQGFPDFFPPDHVRRALVETANSTNQMLYQYTRSYGHPRLVKALSDTFSPMYDRQINQNTEAVVTIGAYGALFGAVQGLVNPEDEVIIIEPYFDCYEPMVKVAGGTPVFIPLRSTKNSSPLSSADWKLDPVELESKFNEKTKAIFLNNPNNPVGKVYSMEELNMVADLCKKYDVLVFADEVYEWLIYHPNQHIKIATLPDMWERTLTIGSAGKTFSVTGWKLGWALGPENLIHALQCVHQNCAYTCPTPTQEAVARAFEYELSLMGKPECYYNSLPAQLNPKRDRTAKFISEVGMVPIIPEGGYFMVADFSQIDVDLGSEDDESKDYRFVKWLMREKKLAGIPTSAFYSQQNKHLAENLIRFCFSKEDSTLEKAEEIIKKWKESPN
ncbi:hypothetical protein CAPTEDRAFT_93247 [Capitella teleta]|uniref:Aminotransferase class I/classII large domain-containing protein n=1 Tax=Capitella teleta TaxID=283909 RepID=X2BBW9_CAPTE|nr:hypothetical protein CAPTEDRAFT_93247 [Capitella teleta]|eukprot:ELU10164.1 hypothetical protein CAPTEDRAFT_93247 [Capitella teleta]